MRSRRSHPLRLKVADAAAAVDAKGPEQAGEEAPCRELRVVEFRVFGVLLPEQGDRVAERMEELPGVELARTDFVHQVLHVEYLPEVVTPQAIQLHLRTLGFEAGPASGAESGGTERRSRADWGWAAWVLLFGGITLGLWAGSGWLAVARLEATLVDVGQFLAISLGMVVLGSRLRENIRADVANLTLTGSSYLALVCAFAYAAALYGFVSGGAAPFHLCGGVQVTLALWWLGDLWTRGRAAKYARLVENSMPETGIVRRRGRFYSIPWRYIEPEDDILVSAGGTVPVDSTVVSGAATCGADFPQSRVSEVGPGELLWAGTQVESGSLVLKSEQAQPRRALARDLKTVLTASRATVVPGDGLRQWLERYGGWVALGSGLAALVGCAYGLGTGRSTTEVLVAFLVAFPFTAFVDVRDLAVRATLTRLLAERTMVLRPDLLFRHRSRPVYLVVHSQRSSLESAVRLASNHRGLGRRVTWLWVGPAEEVPAGLANKVTVVDDDLAAAAYIRGACPKDRRYFVLTDIETARQMDLRHATHFVTEAFWGERFPLEVGARLVESSFADLPPALDKIHQMRRLLALLSLSMLVMTPVSVLVFRFTPEANALWVAAMAYGWALMAKLVASR